MNDKIIVNWEVNTSSGTESISLEEVECVSIKEWRDLPIEEQDGRLQTALDNLPDRTCIMVEGWISPKLKE